MDDDLDLPDNDDQPGGLIDSLFGDRQRTKREGSAGSRRPTVRFVEPTRDPPPLVTTPQPSGTNRPATTPQPSGTNRPATSESNISGLFDNLFPSSSAVEANRRQQSRRGTPAGGRQEGSDAGTSMPAAQPQQQSNAELEQLKREASTLRFEKNELQQTVSEMQRTQTTLVENHEKTLRTLRNEHQEEINRLKREHAEELSHVRISIQDDVDVVRNVRRQEDQLVTVQTRLENVAFTLNGLKDTVNSMGNYNDAINRIVDLADQQINQGMSSLHTEIDNWERRRQTLLTSVEQEINRLSNKYTEEIVQGRKWVEAERDRLHAEQQAFQEEQIGILGQIEQKRAELDRYRTEFITKEHDLLVRVVNEKAQLEEQRREFQRQRNGDIIRMREEAEHLERCLQQVEQSHKALERTRKELEERHRELDELHDQLILHETNYLKHSQGFL